MLLQVDDLLDANAVSSALQGLPGVTHIFHCAYLTSGSDQYKDAVDNLALLKHVVEAVEASQRSGALISIPTASDDEALAP